MPALSPTSAAWDVSRCSGPVLAPGAYVLRSLDLTKQPGPHPVKPAASRVASTYNSGSTTTRRGGDGASPPCPLTDHPVVEDRTPFALRFTVTQRSRNNRASCRPAGERITRDRLSSGRRSPPRAAPRGLRSCALWGSYNASPTFRARRSPDGWRAGRALASSSGLRNVSP